MPATLLKPETSETLHRILATLASAMTAAIKPMIHRELTLQPGGISLCGVGALLGSLRSPTAVVRGALDKEYSGRTLRLLIDARDATVLSGCLLMTPDTQIEGLRKSGTLEGEHLQAFSEVGNVLCAGIAQALRGQLGDTIDLRLQDHGIVEPGKDERRLLGDQDLVCFALKLKIADHPESNAMLLVDPATAEKWQGRPLEWAPADAGEGEALSAAGARPSPEEEEIPAAPLRGRLAAFTVDAELLPVLRKSCRRVGLELDRHTRTEIPNPAAHKDQLVLIEIPTNEDRRFDWCKRLKSFSDSIKVVLLLHHPSRARVLQGFSAKADMLLAAPVSESLLSQKLGVLLDVVLKTKEARTAPEGSNGKPPDADKG